MFHSPSPRNPAEPRRTRYTEALLVLAILALGGFALVSEGRVGLDTIIDGLNETLSR